MKKEKNVVKQRIKSQKNINTKFVAVITWCRAQFITLDFW